MKLPSWSPPQKRNGAFAEVRMGLRAVAADKRILAKVCLMCAVNLIGFAFATLMPAWAVQVLGGDARMYVFLQGFRGLGALVAVLSVAALSHRRFKGKAMTIGSISFPIFVILFSLTRTLALSLAALFMVGVSNVLMGNVANALVQTMSPGALLAGGTATFISVPLTVDLSALGLLVCAVAIALKVPALRRLP